MNGLVRLTSIPESWEPEADPFNERIILPLLQDHHINYSLERFHCAGDNRLIIYLDKNDYKLANKLLNRKYLLS